MHGMTLVRSRLHVLSLLVTLLLVMLLVGCGGGGATVTRLEVMVRWGAVGGVDGQSQRVQLFDLEGRLAAPSRVVNRTEGDTLVPLEVGSGVYRLRVDLFQGPNLSGLRTGEIETLVEVHGRTGFQTLAGATPTQIRVTPGSATVDAQFSRRFFATGVQGSFTVFLAPGTVQWSVLGGGASINDEGLAVGETPGTVTIRATHTPTGLIGAATLTVRPFEAQRGKWTILVFMNAANDLFSFSQLNMNQMESVAGNPDVRFVVQWKQSQTIFPSSSFDGTRRYLVRPDNTSEIRSELIQDMGGGIDMGRPETLAEFVRWGKTYFPADRYVLVVWNHGNGWRRSPDFGRAVSYDDEFGSAIQAWELAQALGDETVDILAWDASLMQMIEVAYEVQDKATLIVGSEESPPGEGYPYDLIFREFRDRPDDSTANLAKAFVDGMLAVPAYATRRITQSVIDSSQLPALGAAVDGLAAELIAHRNALTEIVPALRNETQSYSRTTVRFFYDLDHLCENLAASSAPLAVRNAANVVRDRVAEAVIWEGHNDRSPNSRGIAIDFSPGDVFASSSVDYGRLRFARETRWRDWLLVAP